MDGKLDSDHGCVSTDGAVRSASKVDDVPLSTDELGVILTSGDKMTEAEIATIQQDIKLGGNERDVDSPVSTSYYEQFRPDKRFDMEKIS